jgi:hypothetical protein
VTALGQVVHVARKDMGAVGWFLLAYAALLVSGAYLFLTGAVGMAMATGLLSFLAAWLVVGVAVQADPPTRPDAFWVTRPLSPAAVFGAKLVAIAAVMGLGLAAHLYVMHMHDVEVHEMLAESGAVLLSLGSGLATALLVAALARDLAGFLAGSFGLLVVLQAAALLLTSLGVEGTDPSPGTVLYPVTWAVVVLGLASWQYRRRDVRKGRIALVGAVLVGAVAAHLLPTMGSRDVGTAAVEVTGRIEGELTSTGSTRQVRLHGTLPVRAPAEGTRPLLLAVSARIRMPDGREESVRLVDQSRAMMRGFAEDPIYSAAYPDGFPLSILHLTGPQWEALRAGTALVVVEGTAIIQRRRELASIAVDDRRVHTARGVRIRVDRADPTRGPGVAVTMSGVTGAGRATQPGEDLSYLLVGASPGDTLRPQRRQSGSTRGTLVSRRAWSRNDVLRLPVARGEAPIPQWPEDARLRVSMWENVETYPVRITAALAEGGAGTAAAGTAPLEVGP